MNTPPVKPVWLAQLEEFARRHGKGTADALDDVLADSSNPIVRDHEEIVSAVRQDHADMTPGRTRHTSRWVRVGMAFGLELSEQAQGDMALWLTPPP